MTDNNNQTADKAPNTYRAFVARYPKLGEAWELIGQSSQDGPLDEKSVRLIKLAVAAGALREGAVHSNVRKALDSGISVAELEQVVAIAAGTLGMPASAALFTWINDVVDQRSKKDK